MAARDVDNNCENVNYSFVTATISARFVQNQFVPYKTSGSSVFLAMHKLRAVTVIEYVWQKGAGVHGHQWFRENSHVCRKDHCSFHFLLKITIYVDDFQKNKLLETEYDVAAVLQNNPKISL